MPLFVDGRIHIHINNKMTLCGCGSGMLSVCGCGFCDQVLYMECV